MTVPAWWQGTGNDEDDRALFALYCELSRRHMNWLDDCVRILREKWRNIP